MLCEKHITSLQFSDKLKREYPVHTECLIDKELKALKKEAKKPEFSIKNFQYSCCAEEVDNTENYGWWKQELVCQDSNFAHIIVGKCRGCGCEVTKENREDSKMFKDNYGYQCHDCEKQEKAARMLSFLFVTHSRLGAESHLQSLDDDSLALICSYAGTN